MDRTIEIGVGDGYQIKDKVNKACLLWYLNYAAKVACILMLEQVAELKLESSKIIGTLEASICKQAEPGTTRSTTTTRVCSA